MGVPAVQACHLRVGRESASEPLFFNKKRQPFEISVLYLVIAEIEDQGFRQDAPAEEGIGGLGVFRRGKGQDAAQIQGKGLF